ncbi:MAG: hypothetical protein CVT49_09235 [candidate division Zixibacteria bacterium HGW-Zixibacteria-1]|nr:MAG: hypothetical protein CVT49_09235 [candidate division Zixibacteria bacterium HGW-Zixibacteria-1]
MKTVVISLGALMGLLILSAVAMADEGQLYGKIYTVDDEVLEGFIRWDKNEASWCDLLDGTKELEGKKYRKYRRRDNDRRDRSVKIFGMTIYSEGDNIWSFTSAEAGIRMGHIAKLSPAGDNTVMLELKSGEEVELSGGSGDIGEDNREILIDDLKEGIIEIYWDEIDHIEFMNAPKKESAFGKRLYGTLTTRRGETFSGYIGWDMDETFDGDILDGREGRRKRKIEFSNIASIERRSSSSAEVTLKNGKTMEMDDSNDIDSGNRGIVISDLKLGSVRVNWDGFDRLDFSEPPGNMTYNDFDGGKKLHGTVITEGGEKYAGNIVWDSDEEFTWEILNGDMRDVEFDIEFGMIKAIEKMSSRTSMVTLKDGRTFKLRGSNDVDSDNKGIIVMDGRDEIVVDWDDFESVEFDQ